MTIAYDSAEYSNIQAHYNLWLKSLEMVEEFYKNNYNSTEEGKLAFAQFREEGYGELARRDIAYAEYREKFGDPEPEEFLHLESPDAQMFMTLGIVYLYPKISKYLDSLGLGNVYISVDRMQFYVDGYYRSNPSGMKVLEGYKNWTIVHNIESFFEDDDE